MKMRVAIIEDEYYTRQAIRKYVEAAGEQYECIGEADNGQSGLELLREKKPDIALVDITMPYLNGIDMMHQAVEEHLPTKMIILTGYSDFTYVREALRLGAVDYLLKPLRMDDLRKALSRIEHSMEQGPKELPAGIDLKRVLSNQLAEELTREGADSIDVGILVEHLSYPVNSGLYYIAIVEISEPASHITVRACIQGLIEEGLNRKHFKALVHKEDRDTICLIINTPDSIDSALLTETLHDIAREIYKAHGASLKISLSNPRPDMASLRDAYQEAMTIRRFHIFQTSNAVSLFTSEDDIRTPGNYFDATKRSRMTYLLTSHNSESLAAFIRECFMNLKCRGAVSSSVFLCAVQMLSVIWEYQETSAKDPDQEEMSTDVMNKVFTARNIDELQEIIINEAMFASIFSETDPSTYSALIRRVQEYIVNNFMNSSLRLEDIAQANYISTSHLCSIYRRSTGLTVGDYILNTRMHHAEILIRNGHRNIASIAEMCGYDDPGYFSKCFRKKFGVSPKQYME